MPKFPNVNYPFPFFRNPPRNTPNFYSVKNQYVNPFCENTYQVASTGNIPSSPSIATAPEEIKNPRNSSQKNKSNENNDDCLFDLFGLKFYYDDVLLISLIYFLYSEEVKDDGLFIVLILLLLS